MNRSTVVGLLAAISLAWAGPVVGQNGSAGGGAFGIAPFAGYLLSEPLIEGPLGSSVGASAGPLYGGQLSLPLAASLSLIGTAAYTSSDLEAGIPIVGGVSVGDSEAWLFDAGLEFRPDGLSASGLRFVPVLQVGGGVVRREMRVAGIAAESTDFAFTGGLGADFPLGSNLSLRLMAKDYYGRVDLGSLGPVEAKTDNLHSVALSGGLRLAF